MSKSSNRIGKAVIFLLICAAIVAIGLVIQPPAGLSRAGWSSLMTFAAIIVMMISGVLPYSICGLLGLAVMVLSGVTKWAEVYSGFGLSIMLTMVGTYAVTACMQNTSIPLRIAIFVSKLSRSNSRLMVLFFMLGAGVVSSFMSNLASVGVFSGVALRLVSSTGKKPGESNFGKCMLIGCALGAGLGGNASPIGSAQNLAALAIYEQVTGKTVTFASWLGIGYPLMVVVLAVCWLIITTMWKPEKFDAQTLANFKSEEQSMKKLDNRELKGLIIMALMVLCWILSSWIKWMSSATISIIGVSLFMLPGIEVFDFKFFRANISWDMQFMIGSIIAVVAILNKTGASQWLVDSFLSGIGGMSPLMMIIVLTLLTAGLRVVFPVGMTMVTLLTMPYLTLAMQYGFSPLYALMVIVFWSGAAFVLPLDAVPGIAMSSGYFNARDYVKQGIPNTIAAIVILVVLLSPLCSILG